MLAYSRLLLLFGTAAESEDSYLEVANLHIKVSDLFNQMNLCLVGCFNLLFHCYYILLLLRCYLLQLFHSHAQTYAV